MLQNRRKENHGAKLKRRTQPHSNDGINPKKSTDLSAGVKNDWSNNPVLYMRAFLLPP